MSAVRRLLLIVSFILILSAGTAFGSATNIYITPDGNPTGNCPSGANTHTPSWFNTAGNWGSGASQIGPGTTVLMCGTFTSNVQGGNALTVRGSGTSGNPIILQCDTVCNFNSTGWWGSYNDGLCSNCTGAITANSVSYITIDGKGTGIIQNVLAGCVQGGGNQCDGNVSATCLGGACTQQPGTNGTVGIHLYGDHLVAKNWTIQNMYVNAGATSDTQNNDVQGEYSVDIRLDGCPSGVCNIEVGNNTLNDARGGIWGSASGSTGPPSCPGVGVCYHDNKLSGHVWPMLINESASNGIVNIYNTEIGDIGSLKGWLNWQFPSYAYHQSGMFVTGTGSVLASYVWNNYIHGDLGQSSPSGLLYCPNWGNAMNAGCRMTGWNNVVVGTGSAFTNDQIVTLSEPNAGLNQTSSVTLYNSTLVNGAYAVEVFTAGDNNPSVDGAFTNNIFSGSGSTWHYNASNGGTYINSWAADNNVYYNGNGNPWQYDNTAYSTLSTWHPACSCDAHAVVGDPKLSVNYTLQAGSAAIGAAANLTSLCTGNLAGLCTDKDGNQRPATGAWDAGAYQYSIDPPPNPPTGLTATVQ